MTEPILRLTNVSKSFPVRAERERGIPHLRRERLHALQRVSLEVTEGETLGIVGESGCGKSTLAKLLVRLLQPDSGQVFYRGRELKTVASRDLRRIQMVFQNPYGSLNPRLTIGNAIAEPLRVYQLVDRKGVYAEVDRLLDQVGLASATKERYPLELSGGQCQRVAIARALAVRPEILIADEAVSSLDVSVQAQILNLLADLRDALNLTVVAISHDLGVIEYLCDRIGVMYLGHLVEWGTGIDVLKQPGHPYTRGLLESVPSLDPRNRSADSGVRGELPSAITLPEGCVFRPRCSRAQEECIKPPPTVDLNDEHWANCFFATDVQRDSGKHDATTSQPSTFLSELRASSTDLVSEQKSST